MSGSAVRVLAQNRELCQASDKGPLVPELAPATALARYLLVGFQVSWSHSYLELQIESRVLAGLCVAATIW